MAPKPPPPPPDYGDEIVLDWGDQKAAPVKPEFWRDLFTAITTNGFSYDELVFCCVGGHGRTGTAIASLALAAHVYDEMHLIDPKTKKQIPDDEVSMAERAMAYVRHHYCKQAIESEAQVEYLELVDEFVNGPNEKPN